MKSMLNQFQIKLTVSGVNLKQLMEFECFN